MITTNRDRIAALTSAGGWGSETLHGLLARHASERPHSLAVKDQPNRDELTGDQPLSLTWSALEAASDSLAAQLQERGVGEDDCLLVQLPNVVELLALYYAVSKIGAIISPVPVQYGRHELQMLATCLRAKTAVTIARLRDTELAAGVCAALPKVRTLVFGEDLHIDTGNSGLRCRRATEDANRILSICWTSGTTGTPKGVPRSHNMWIATGRCSAAAGNMVPQDILLNPFPLVNMAALGGFVYPAALTGGGIVLHQPLDPPLFLQQMQDEKVTFTIAPPALLNQLARSPEMWRRFDFSTLRRIGSGSAPLAPWMIETFDRDFGVQVVNFYGSNEGIALFATPETAPQPEVRATMFPRPAPGALVATKVSDPETGVELRAVGERGELMIAGATVFDGYFEHDNEGLFSPDGFFRSGDLVEICGEEGDYYRIVGRCKDIINRGGMKISPVELDLALERHPDLAEAAVCAWPDDILGEKICACLVPRLDTAVPTLEQLQAFLLERGLAKFKLPERIEVFDRLPRNPLGKVQRFSLQDRVSK